MNRVVHFEILVDDLERAKKFYQEVFGWKIEGWGDEGYLLIDTGTGSGEVGINGGMMKRSGIFENAGEGFRAFPCTIDVSDIDETVTKIKEAGGQIVKDKNEIPNVGIHVYFKDTEGNVVGAMQSTGDPM